MRHTEKGHQSLYADLIECPKRCRGGYPSWHDDGDAYGASRNDEVYCEDGSTSKCYRTGSAGDSVDNFYDCPEWGVLCRMPPGSFVLHCPFLWHR